MLADVYVLPAAGRIILEQVSPSVSSVSEDEQQDALEDFRNEQVGLIWGCAVQQHGSPAVASSAAPGMTTRAGTSPKGNNVVSVCLVSSSAGQQRDLVCLLFNIVLQQCHSEWVGAQLQDPRC